MLVVFKANDEGNEMELKGEGVSVEQVVFMVESGIKILKEGGAKNEEILKLVNDILKEEEN